jgi:hypothetical protein
MAAQTRLSRGPLIVTLLVLASMLSTALGADTARVELPNGDVYEGEMVDDRRTGQGTYTWADQRTYVGTFLNDRRHGRGELAWPNGDRYEGEFRQDQMTGRGRFVWDNTDRYEGDFVAGQRTGQGVYTWHTGERYQGFFKGGKLHGRGVFTWPDGRRYEGDFVAGLKRGDGIFEWPNGNRYVGRFEDDERQGLGVFYWRDGTVYRGHFAQNKMHGFGLKRHPDGEAEFQQWTAGVLAMSAVLANNPRCQMSIDEEPWMFQGDECVNGLAHGRGPAVSLDGGRYLGNARLVLGQLIEGEVRSLDTSTRSVAIPVVQPPAPGVVPVQTDAVDG